MIDDLERYFSLVVTVAVGSSAISAFVVKAARLMDRESGTVGRFLTRLLGYVAWPFHKLSLAFLAGLSIGLIILAVVLGVRVFSPSTAPSVTIASPQDGSRAGIVVPVEGRSAHIGSDRSIWLFVQPHLAPKFHPQPGPVPRRLTGEWSGRVQLGDPSHEPAEGEKFDVLAVLTTRQASAVIERYLARSARSGSYPGLDVLPAGAEIGGEITVLFSRTG